MKPNRQTCIFPACESRIPAMIPFAQKTDNTTISKEDIIAHQWEEIKHIISQYYGEWTSPNYPGAVNRRIPNTALLGNGDVGVSSDGDEQTKIFRISKGDFWEYNGSPLPIGTIAVSAYAKATANSELVAFYEKEDILNAEIFTQQTLTGAPIQIKSWVSATHNLFVMEITSLSQTTGAYITVTLEAFSGEDRPVTAVVEQDRMIVTRSTLGANPQDPDSYTSKAVMATHLIGANANYAKENESTVYMTFHLPAEETAFIVTAIGGGSRTYNHHGMLWNGRIDPVDEAISLSDKVSSPVDVEKLRESHAVWWKRYWLQSYISLDTSDPDLATLQKYYYAALYELGSGIREGKVAAGLYAIWHTTDNAGWNSDFHLNYNFVSTYYPLATMNRAPMILPAVDALMDYLPRGTKNAGSIEQLQAVRKDFVDALIQNGQIDSEKGIENAILYPVGIGPFSMTLDHAYHSETVNAPFSAYPFIEYYNHTRDEVFMKETLYVYLKYVLTFLEHWIIEEDGKYTIYAGYNEQSWSKNPAIELLAYKLCLKYGISISDKLGVDADHRETWLKIYDGLAPQPIIETYAENGKTVLALAESVWNGTEWIPSDDPLIAGRNCIALEAVVPGEVLGYYSSDEELEIANNTITLFGESGAWTDGNSFPKLFTAAINTRYDCNLLVKAFASSINAQMQPNLMIEDYGHGIEKAGAAEAINNMMLLSDKCCIKLFGNWPADKDAKFVRLRASGAFLFSAEYNGDTNEIKEGAVMYSEAGETATIASLWNDGMTVLDDHGVPVKTQKTSAPNHKDEIIYTFETEVGKTYTFVK